MKQSSTMSVLLLSQLMLVLLSTMPRSISCFMIPSTSGSTTPSFTTSLAVTAATPFGEMEKEHQTNSNDENNTNKDDDDDWTPVAGGFLPRLKKHFKSSPTTPTTTTTTTPSPITIVEVSTLQEYKHHVVDCPEEIVVVKFYSTWCRSCKAMAPLYKKLAKDMLQEAATTTTTTTRTADGSFASSSSSTPPPPSPSPPCRIKFVQVPVTPENAMLHQGLSVPSVPFGHIYHKAVGLVEESSLNKKEFQKFSKLVSQYVKGECNVLDEELGQE